MSEQLLDVGQYKVRLFSPKDRRTLPLIFLLDARPQGAAIRDLLSSRLNLAVVEGLDWYRDLTPWPADRAFNDGETYGSGAAAFLQRLTDELVPATEQALGGPAVERGLAGYSLGGLFAVWSIYQTDCFSLIASMSGSLWYDGFDRFCEQNQPVSLPRRLYLSLGAKEKLCRSPQVAEVERLTIRSRDRFRALGVETCFQLQPGGHHAQVNKRIAEGLSWLARREKAVQNFGLHRHRYN